MMNYEERLDFFAVNAPSNAYEVTHGAVRAFYNKESHWAPTAEEEEFVRCIKRYQWARQMIEARAQVAPIARQDAKLKANK